MTFDTLRKTGLTVLAVGTVTLGASLVSTGPSMAAGLIKASPIETTAAKSVGEVIKVGAKKRRIRKRIRHHRRHHRHHRHGWHGRYFYYGPDCFWKKRRFWDGYGYYWKRVRVCY